MPSKYLKKWEETRPWLKPGDTPEYANCTACKKQFRVDGSGICQVTSHTNSDTHKRAVPSKSQTLLQILPTGQVSHTGAGAAPEALSDKMQALKAEVIDVMYKAQYNYSFSSAQGDGDRYRLMFPGHPAAENYSCSSTKSAYMLQYGIGEILKEDLKKDMQCVPYTFKFDETTTSQVKKQYDGYICYWSPSYDQVVNMYAGSLFVGHCPAKELVRHFYEMTVPLSLDGEHLLHIGKDGPNVNLKFEEDLCDELYEKEETTILNLGSCSLHPVHTAFKKGLQELDFGFESFFNDISFFFKLSAARREDYSEVAMVTGIAAEFAKKFGATRWLCMKKVGVRCLEQWKNLIQYFMKFLPTTSTFKYTIQGTNRYIRIKDILQKSTSEAYLAFMCFSNQDFESFLRRFQYEQPMIHMLYPAMVDMIRSIMVKFVRKKYLTKEDGSPKSDEDILAIDPLQSSICKPLSSIDVGTRAKLFLSDSTLFPSEASTKFRQECLRFFQVSTRYLLDNLPHKKKFIKHAQYLHHEKRNSSGAMSAISNMTSSILQVLGGKISAEVFCTNRPKEEVIDLVRQQYSLYQLESIPEDFFLISEEQKKGSPAPTSYWPYALEYCGLEQEVDTPSCFKRIDHYWRSVGGILNDEGKLKYPQLFALVKCVLSCSHGNSVPERGFSINKKLLDVHGYSLSGDTIVALRLVKDKLLRVGGVANFPITKNMLSVCSQAYSKYEAALAKKRDEEKAESERARMDAERLEKSKAVATELSKIERQIKLAKKDSNVATKAAEEANESIQKYVVAKKMSKVEEASSKLSMAMDAKKRAAEKLELLQAKRKKIEKK